MIPSEPQSIPRSVDGRIAALDGVRGLAILAVVLHHLYHVKLLWMGVDLFFVLSGFLITGILVQSKGTSFRRYIGHFYQRRVLRILPPYLLALVVTSLAWKSRLILDHWYYYIGGMNLLAVRGIPQMGNLPLWSLAVEEQFYAVWPWLYRRLKRKGLFLLCLSIILLCPVLRGVTKSISEADIFSKTFMIGDNLAVGAAIAILCRSQRLSLKGLVRIGAVAVGVSGLTLLVLSNLGRPLKGDVLGASLGYSMLEWFTGGILILMLYAYRTRPIQKGLAFFLFFGEISYGLYLIHLLCGTLYDRVAGKGYLTDAGELLSRFIIVNGIAVLLAALSKRYFENPIIGLREKIPAAIFSDRSAPSRTPEASPDGVALL